jgi:hypothetical protein
MSILNPSMNKMIAELVAMPPQQLAQYAAANQNDTMKFLAAKAASDIQKKQQAAGAAQQQQAAPPVAQQVVQQMAQGLPEESGIGALPAPNMQKMAGGGIVAFADGGDIPGFAAGAFMETVPGAGYTPYAPYGGGGAPNQGLLPDTTPYEDMSIGELVSTLGREGAAKFKDMMRDKTAEKWENYNVNYGTEGKRTSLGEAPTSVATMPTDATRRGDIRAPGGIPTLTSVSAPVGQRGATPSAGAGATTAPGAGPMSITELQKLQASLMPKGQVDDPYAAQHEKNAKLREAQGKEELAGAEERKAGLAGLLAPKEQRIKDKEARLQKTDDQNLNMSLINAGLAMMQSTGRGLAGLAEGATAGVKQYSEGLKLSEAARQKIEDAKDAFDELKFNQTNMSQKEITAAKHTIAEGAIASNNETIAGIKEATGVKTKAAEAVFTNYVHSRESAADRASRERTSAASNQTQRDIAAMPGREEHVAGILGAGGPQADKLRQGMEELVAIRSGKFNVDAEYAKALSDWVKGGGVAGPKPTRAEYVAQFAKPKVVDVGKQTLLARPGG